MTAESKRTTAASQLPPPPASGWSRLLAILSRTALVCFLGWQVYTGGLKPVSWPVNLDEAVPDEWGGKLVRASLLMLAHCAVLGVLVSMAFALPRTFWKRQSRSLLVLGSATMLTAGLIWLAYREFPPPWQLIPAYVGTLMGIWIGTALQGGFGGVFRFLLQLFLTAALLAGVGIYAERQLLSDEPSLDENAHVTREEKAQLAETVREQLSRATKVQSERDEDKSVRIELKEEEINTLVSWLLKVHADRFRTRVSLEPGKMTSQFSIQPLPWRSRYLNVEITGPVSVDSGSLELDVDRFQIGTIQIPPGVLRRVIPAVVGGLERQAEMQRLLGAVDQLQLESGRAAVVGQQKGLRETVLPLLNGDSDDGQLDPVAIRAYVRHLTERAESYPRGDQRFLGLMSEAFRFAAERTETNGDPVAENQSALLALTYLVGMRRLEVLTGEILPARERVRSVNKVRPLTIRGRADWVKHFLVSAVLTVVSNGELSDVIGQWKERIDAQQGGSGFSFADLMADYAGRRFAAAITHDADSARAAQQRLSQPIDIDRLFPTAEGLPEKISAEVWETKYGAGRGAEYERLERTIRNRLDACDLLQAP